jgi:D-alanyl-D-alanine carboxypeptidase/D-alanyl-D-alanine-endopeptidase (penicillin-binding protein 4)
MRKRLAPTASPVGASRRAIDGARALAGYVLDRRGKRVIVVFLANHPNAGATKAAQDALLACVYERSC